jgi:two-component system CheB/CheR fusion protein
MGWPDCLMASRSSMRILLVDDHGDTRHVMVRLFVQRGHEVTTAATLADGRALCESRAFDLLLCDLKLPDGDGHELAAVARSCGAKAISLSGLGMEEVERGDFDAHLRKPISFAQLDEKISQVMHSTPA